MRLLWLAAGVALAAQPAPAAPTIPTAAQGQSEPARAAAARLAELLYAEPRQLAAAERLVDTELAAGFRADENFQTIETEFPGFLGAFLNDLKPVMVAHTRSLLPRYRGLVADLLVAHFSAEELDDILLFYRSPTGQKMLSGLAEHVSAKATIAEALKDPDKPTTFSAVDGDHKAAAAKTIAALDDSDKAALEAFARKPYIARVALIGPAMRKIEQDVSNEPSPELDARIVQIMEAVIARFEAAKR